MFKNNTKLSFELNMEFSKPVRAVLSIFLSIIFLLTGIVMGLLSEGDGIEFIIYLSVFAIIAVLFPLFFHLLYKRALRKAMQKNPFCDENVTNYFVFEQDYLSLSSVRFDNVFSNAAINYNDFAKVIENKDNLYIFVGANQAYILIKSGMTEGSFEDLKEFLKSKLSDGKYYVRKFIFQTKLKKR